MSVPFTRTLPYVLREQLSPAGTRLLIGRVVSIPDADHVRVDISGGQVTVPRITSYVPEVNEPAYVLTGPGFTVALGTVGGIPPGSGGGEPGPPGPAGPAGADGEPGVIEVYEQAAAPPTTEPGAMWIDTDETLPVYDAATVAPAVRAYNTGTPQVVNTATLTPVALNSERFDQAYGVSANQHDNVTNNTRLTCIEAGIYQISGCLDWGAYATGVRVTQIRINGTTTIASQGVQAGASGINIAVSTLYKLAAGDYAELMAYHEAGVALNVAIVPNRSPEFMMARVA